MINREFRPHVSRLSKYSAQEISKGKKNSQEPLSENKAVDTLKFQKPTGDCLEIEGYEKSENEIGRIGDISLISGVYKKDPFADFFLSHANGQFSLVERVLGTNQDRGMNALNQQMKEESLTWRDLVEDFPDREQYFSQAVDAAAMMEESLKNQLHTLTTDAGINIEGDWSLTVNADGSFTVEAGDATKELTHLLSNNRQLIDDVLQAGALETIGNLSDFSMSDTALNAEYVLLDRYLTDNLGYGMNELDLYNLPKHQEDDQAFANLLENDITLQKQLDKFRTMHYQNSSFSTSITVSNYSSEEYNVEEKLE